MSFDYSFRKIITLQENCGNNIKLSSENPTNLEIYSFKKKLPLNLKISSSKRGRISIFISKKFKRPNIDNNDECDVNVISGKIYQFRLGESKKEKLFNSPKIYLSCETSELTSIRIRFNFGNEIYSLKYPPSIIQERPENPYINNYSLYENFMRETEKEKKLRIEYNQRSYERTKALKKSVKNVYNKFLEGRSQQQELTKERKISACQKREKINAFSILQNTINMRKWELMRNKVYLNRNRWFFRWLLK